MAIRRLSILFWGIFAASLLSAKDIGNDLVMHFNFKDAKGKECLDMTGKHKLIALQKIITQNGSLRTGKNVIYMIPNDKSFDMGDEMTICLWCAFKSIAGRQSVIFKGIRNTNPQRAMSLSFTNGKFVFDTTDENGDWAFNAQSPLIETNSWHHFSVIYKAGFVRILMDGKSYFSHQYAPQNLVTNDAAFYVGAGISMGGSIPNTYICEALLNDIRLYKRALSDQELKAVYTSESASYTDRNVKIPDIQEAAVEKRAVPINTEVPDFGEYGNGDRQLYWGKEPVEKISATRARICLNGEWNFYPILISGGKPEMKHAGGIQVPGTWSGFHWKGYTKTVENSIIKRNADPVFKNVISWQQWDNMNIHSAWYRRIIHVPEIWDGRKICLNLSRVSTDARVFVNDVFCGEINWPSGSVDISKAVKPGTDAELAILVTASPQQEDVFLPVWESSNEYKLIEKKVDCSGLVDDVFLSSYPADGKINDVFVKTSTRKKEITLEIEVEGSRGGSAEISAKILNREGIEEKSFSATLAFAEKQLQSFSVSWIWPDPKLWDADNPNIYTLLLEIKGAGLNDIYRQDFGFKEFWIEGKSFFLNGTEIKFRPIVNDLTPFGITEAIDNHIDGFRQNGFNLCSSSINYPKEFSIRGTLGSFAEQQLSRCDLKGFYSFHYLPSFVATGTDFESKRKKWETAMLQELRTLRNHPSLLFWGFFGGNLSHQSVKWPELSGKKSAAESFAITGKWSESVQYAKESFATIKKYDPTRPVTGANAPTVGDICGYMPYLNFIPLQEREEWLSEWAKNGDLPIMMFEYGSPIAAAFARARTSSSMGTSEPWVTEFCAIYMGKRAYELEDRLYRQKTIAEHFIKDQKYRFWYTSEEKTPYASWAPILAMTPQAQELLSLFHRDTWRSWRTWGISGGMFAWEYGAAWAYYNFCRGGINPKRKSEIVQLGEFTPGRRGVYVPKLTGNTYYGLTPLGLPPMPCSKSLVENNKPTLAWIAGSAAAFTEKNHNYVAESQVNKQIVLINDTLKPQPFSAEWKVMAGDKIVADGNESGKILPGKILFIPLSFSLPTTDIKTDGSISLSAKIGESTHDDKFLFRIFPHPRKKEFTIYSFDPQGKTTAMLEASGCAVRKWDGEKDAALVFIGREALNDNSAIPQDFKSYIKEGGRGIIFTQNPDFLRIWFGLRVSRHITRRVFVVDSQQKHPLLTGLDSEDLRDWSGISSLTEAYPSYKINKNDMGCCPPYGWHWGNRGGVASAAIEKPHNSGWRPILECEFDLAYSPLMELDYGKGRLIICTLDLEDHYKQDAAAATLLGNLLDYAMKESLSPKVQNTVFIGNDNEAKLLDEIGLIYKCGEKPEGADLIVAGAGVKDSPELEAYLRNGGKIFLLPRIEKVMGVFFQELKQFPGSLSVPDWKECAGIGISDLHWRTDSKAVVLKDGAEICADGLIGKIFKENGKALFCQINPEGFDKSKTYYRFSQWHSRRTLVNLLSNMGASFRMDERIFSASLPVQYMIDTRSWRIKMGRKLPFAPSLSQKHKDDGISEMAAAMVLPETDERDWHKGTLSMWPNYGGEFAQYCGECVYRKMIILPPEFTGKDIVLYLPCIHDIDDTYFNGEKIGHTEGWNQSRRYEIPGKLVKQNNLLAVRTFQGFRGAGFDVKDSSKIFIGLKDLEKGFYDPDYRTDDTMGDEPYTYYHW